VFVRESLLLFLQDQKRLLEAERLEILSQYGVRSAAELRERIEAGTLPEHPTWENYIELTNLENGLSRLEEQAGALMQTFPKHNPEAEAPHESGTGVIHVAQAIRLHGLHDHRYNIKNQ
jgi:hypothetical protein